MSHKIEKDDILVKTIIHEIASGSSILNENGKNLRKRLEVRVELESDKIIYDLIIGKINFGSFNDLNLAINLYNRY